MDFELNSPFFVSVVGRQMSLQMKSRFGSSWLPSWWRSSGREDSKRGPHLSAGNSCECGLIQLRQNRNDPRGFPELDRAE